MVPPAGRRRRDRLSGLSDDLIGHVLSFLPTKEAGRAAGLSRRWRTVFCNVHTVSFSERPGERADDWDTFYFEAEERKSCSAALLDDVCAALLCRRRCAGHGVPLRRLRFAFDSCHGWDFAHVDTWLAHALRHSGSAPELHLELCFSLCPSCKRRRGGRTGNRGYALPRKLFSCLALRTLSVAHCELNLPAAGAIDLPFLETLSLTGSCGNSGLLISRCPRLVDLTLEGDDGLQKVSVLDRRLRRLALRCCHNVKSVEIDASELTSFDYSGELPMESLLSLHGLQHALSYCTLDFCKARPMASEFDRFRRLLEKLSDTKHLHLHHGNLESRFFMRLPSFPNLTRLVLQGPLRDRAAVGAVGRVLELTPCLEVLSLFMEVAQDERRRHGDEAQRTMARLLFGNALVLERMCVVLVKGTFEAQAKMKEEIESWVVAVDAEQIFL
ncbi:F-box/LRR-repeat protein At3g58900 [Brachypodium distachyon]|uniref:F-box/LRR-repeat protein At3g58900 n=1 Tax=Brachypodium distachyon TaxID=15368 RepID=UPI00052FEBD4|nr:F-box/LRR-repeat protein At3g58900 [Brachypodium distachyon]|eukprot:XP_010227331.1 F-box/LRR-repeat protein At3g58900 [Brachypodium distachyon]